MVLEILAHLRSNMGSVSTCKLQKTCVSDLVAVVIAAITISLIGFGICFLWFKRRTPEVKAKQVSLLALQAFASILWLITLLVTKYMTQIEGHGQWLACYLVQVWIESPAGYCLAVSCSVARAYRLYYVFVRRRLPPLQAQYLVSLLLVPSICTAAVIQWRKPFKQITQPFFYCSARLLWWIIISTLHAGYICMLIISTWLVRNIRFEFNESRELMASIFGSLIFLGVWMGFIFSGYHQNKKEHFQLALQETSSYVFVILGSGTCLCFSFFPVLRPLKAYLGLLKKQKDVDSMGWALGVPSSGPLPLFSSFTFDEPLETLLQHKRFREAFQAFADSRLAGESVRFYVEVRELNRAPANTVTRIYMAQHIIKTYIDIGAPLEINISHSMRSDILSTKDLSNPMLFDHAASEAMNIMHMNLEQDFWQSPQFRSLKEEMQSEVELAEQLEWMNVSSKRDSFSTTDNLFEHTGSPHVPLRHGSPSLNHDPFALPPNPTFSPENLLLQVSASFDPVRITKAA